MSSPIRRRIDDYSTRVAARLREREANSMRGQPEQLRQLELTTDLDLLKKYSWTAAIIAAGVTFIAAPLAASVFRLFLPQILIQLLWAVVKLGMAFSCILFGLAAYFTFWKENETG